MATWNLFSNDGTPGYYQEGIGWGTPAAGDWINAGEGNSYQFAPVNPMQTAQQSFTGIDMNMGSRGMLNQSQIGQQFGRPYWQFQDDQWKPGWGADQGETTPLQQQLLDLMPERVRAGGTVDPVTLFGPHKMAKTGAELALALHKRFGNLPGMRNPVDMAQEYVSGFGPEMGNTAINAPGLTYQQFLRNYLGQEPLAGKGITYDKLNQGGGFDALIQQMNAEGISNAFKRNEAGKKSGFGGMVKGWAQSPGGSLILGTALGPVLGHAFNPAVSGPMSGIGQAASNIAGAISGATSGIPSWLKAPLMSAGKAAITGGNPLTAALTGGLGELGGMFAKIAGLPAELGNMLAKQGLGLYRQNQAMDRYKDMLARRRSVFPQRTIGG